MMNDFSSITTTTTPSSMPKAAQNGSTTKTCSMTGKAPWGFRITTDSSAEITPGIFSLSNLVVVKVRSRSKAYYAGLKEQDVLLFINNQPTYSLTLDMATELIESASDLNLIVSTPNKNSNNNGALKRPGGLLRSGSMYSIYSHRFDSSINNNNNNISSSSNSASSIKSNSLRNINNSESRGNTIDTPTSSDNKDSNEIKQPSSSPSSSSSSHEISSNNNQISESSSSIKDNNQNNNKLVRTDRANSRSISRSTTQLSCNEITTNKSNCNDHNEGVVTNNKANNNSNYLIKPISLKTIRKLNINPTSTNCSTTTTAPELYNKNTRGISRDNTSSSNLLNSLISPTNSTASTNSFFNISSSQQPNKKAGSTGSTLGFTRLYNTPPKSRSTTSSSQQQYKLEARQLAQKYRSSKNMNTTQRIYYSTDQEEEDDTRSRLRCNAIRNNRNNLHDNTNLPKSLSSYAQQHNAQPIHSQRSGSNQNLVRAQRAYYSATESLGEEDFSDYYPSEYEILSNRSIPAIIPKKNQKSSIPAYPPLPVHNSYNKRSTLISSSTNNLYQKVDNANSAVGGEDEEGVSRVSYASITLRQPLKDINYFSDTEAIHSGVHNQRGFKLKPSLASTHNLQQLATSSSTLTQKNKNNDNDNPSYSLSTSANHKHLTLNNNYLKSTNRNETRLAPIGSASSLAYRNLTYNKFLFNSSESDQNTNTNTYNNSNNNISNLNKSSAITSSRPHQNNNHQNPNPALLSANRTNTDLLIKRADSLFSSTNINNSGNTTSSQEKEKTTTPTPIRKTYQYSPQLAQPTATSSAAMSTSLSGFMKSNMLPEFPAHGDDSMNNYQQSMNYNANPKGFVSSSINYSNSMNSHQQQQTSSYTSMPVKWQPQPQQQPPQQQYQQYQPPPPQQYYQEEYQQSNTPKPDPQEIFARSLAQSRSEQNEYLAAMQRNDDYGEEDEEYQRYAQSIGTGMVGGARKDKPKYSDSYFYNSPNMKYPTINQQKELARTIAKTLEGSDAATSKYHKKKETINRQFNDGEETYEESQAHHQSNGYYASQQQQSYQAYSQRPVQVLPSNGMSRDDDIPDVIKRSIAQANMINPISNVQAPEYFKEAHFTETSSHTECSPSGAIQLASALDGHTKGGKGQTLFQKRKARMDKLSENEEIRQQHVSQQQQHYAAFQQQFNGQQQQQQPTTPQPTTPQANFQSQTFMTPSHFQHKKQPPVQQQPQQFQQQQQQHQQQYQQVQQQEAEQYHLPNIANNVSTNKFSNFNIKPRGWGAVSGPSCTSTVQPSVSHFELNPMSPRPIQQQQSQATSRTSINIVSSHDNHLFNSRNAQQHQYQPQQPQQSTVQFTIAQPNQMPKQPQQQQQQPKAPEAPKMSSYSTGPIQYQIYNDEDIAASDL